MYGNCPQHRQSKSLALGNIRFGPLHVDGEAERGIVEWIHEHPFLCTHASSVANIWPNSKRLRGNTLILVFSRAYPTSL